MLRSFAHSTLRRAVRAASQRTMSVLVSSDGEGEGKGKVSPFTQHIKVGKHTLVADEPEKVGGHDKGPSPYDLLLSALGACTNMTIRMYAERKGIPLEGVSVQLDHEKTYAKDCADCAAEVTSKGEVRIDHISRAITLHGSKLSEKDRANCLRIANMCPVHKTLEQSSVVTTSLKDPSTPSPTAAALVTHIAPREAELGPGFVVRRVLPFHKKRAVGPWIFCDHFGPVDVSGKPGAAKPMDVGPHPHIGVATLTYLFSGAILHRDSIGVEQVILPGQVNYMSSGRGVVHAERGAAALPHFAPHAEGKKILHGLQMWLGLPVAHEDAEPRFHHAPEVPDVSGAMVVSGAGRAELVAGRVGAAEAAGIPQLAPLFMLTLHLEPGAVARVPLLPKHEACVLACLGRVEAGAEQSVLDAGQSAVYAAAEGAEGDADSELLVRAPAGGAGTSVVAVFGGLPLPEPRHMLWNFAHSDRRKLQLAADAWRRLDRAVFPPVVNEPNDDNIPLPSTSPRPH